MYLGEELKIATETVFMTTMTFSIFVEPTLSLGVLSAIIANQGMRKIYEKEKIKSKKMFPIEKEMINRLLKKEKNEEKIKRNNIRTKEINSLIKQCEQGNHFLKRKIEANLYRFQKELREE